ncbi:MAG TPA: nuclear transport factor 2 family protein [Afipia sp.]
MNNSQSEQCVRTFIDAYYTGDATRMEQCCDDTFTSFIYAPLEIFPHLGLKKSTEWIARSIQIQQERYSSRRYVLDFVIANETQGAAFVQATMTKRSDQRIIRVNTGDFFILRGGRITEHRSLFDSFDLVQQLIGHDLTDEVAARVRNAMRP